MNKILISLIFVIVGLCSCGEGFFLNEIELPDRELDEQVSVVARLTNLDFEEAEMLIESSNDLLPKILVANTLPITSTTDFQVNEDALVRLSNDNGQSVDYSYDEQLGSYVVNDLEFITSGASGTYQLDIEIPGQELISATAAFPRALELNNLTFEPENIEIDNQTLDRIEFGLDFDTDEAFFEIEAYYAILDTMSMDSFIWFFSPNIFNVQSSFGETVNRFVLAPEDRGALMEFWTDRPNFFGSIPTRLVLMIRTLSEEEYRYLESLENNIDAGSNPFVEPTVLFDNIDNGIGVFSLSHIQTRVFEL